ncbi:hypothetical protein SDC9_169491 [bioreactor metagenome]|uniref:Uncharacterized protein n=1 Tax=bioreactor metagenome TaxID=1076179 RepID=A0A645G5H1_9ZZZZ
MVAIFESLENHTIEESSIFEPIIVSNKLTPLFKVATSFVVEPTTNVDFFVVICKFFARTVNLLFIKVFSFEFITFGDCSL